MATALEVGITAPEHSFDIKCHRFWIEHGDHQAQVRLDGENEVYLSYTTGWPRQVVSKTVSAEVFDAAFREMVDRLVA